MLALEWRLTLLGMAVLPAFLLLGKRFSKALRETSRKLMEHNARLGAIMNETLNISGMLLVKLFGRRREEQGRFGEQAAAVRDGSVRQAVVGSRFFIFMGVATAVGTAAIYLVGGHLVIRGALTIGTVVAFSAYLSQLYGPLRSLSNVPVMVAQSLVSFERVFEVLDLPVDIEEAADAVPLTDAVGHLEFRAVSFRYEQDRRLLLSEAKRAARAEDMAFSGHRFGRSADAARIPPAGNGAGVASGGPQQRSVTPETMTTGIEGSPAGRESHTGAEASPGRPPLAGAEASPWRPPLAGAEASPGGRHWLARRQVPGAATGWRGGKSRAAATGWRGGKSRAAATGRRGGKSRAAATGRRGGKSRAAATGRRGGKSRAAATGRRGGKCLAVGAVSRRRGGDDGNGAARAGEPALHRRASGRWRR